MKKFLTIITFSFTVAANAQSVGIGTTTPDANAILDLGVGTKGFLLPRVSDVNMNAMTPPPGMMLYNFNLGRPYMYVGTWKKVMLEGDPFSLPYAGSGNSGSTLFGITQASSSSAIFGNNTGGGVGISGNAATGEAIRGTSTSGTGGYFSSTSGRAIVGVGDVWLNNTDGKTMIGNLSAPLMQLHVSNATDTALVLIDNNTALATGTNVGTYFKNGSWYTGAIKTTGSGSNVARMSFWTFASSNTSGLKERMSILDNGNVGINNNNPAATLDVNGTVKISGGSPGAGKVLTSDGSGNGSWQTLPSQNSGFRVNLNTGASLSLPLSGQTTIPFEISGLNHQYDDGNDFNNVINSFVAPSSGLYHFTALLSFSGLVSSTGNAQTIDVYAYTNSISNPYYFNETYLPKSATTINYYPVVQVSFDAKLTAGEAMKLVIVTNCVATSTPKLEYLYDRTFFSGYRIY
jgi:hypothetical protein